MINENDSTIFGCNNPKEIDVTLDTLQQYLTKV